MSLLVIFLILFLIYILNSYYNKIKKIHQNELKGPSVLPILGNLHQLGTKPHLPLTDMHSKYGDIYRIYMGDCYTVIVGDANILREMFIQNFDNFIDRPLTPSFKFFSSDYRSLSLGNGEHWKRNKTIVGNALTKSKLKTIYSLIDEQVVDLLNSMKTYQSSGQPFPPRRYIQKFTMNTMLKYIFNEQIPAGDDMTSGKLGELVVPIEEIFKFLSSGKLGDFIDILGPAYYWYLNKTHTSLGKIKKFIRDLYDDHFKTIDRENPRDLLDLLICEIGGESEDDIDVVIHVCVDLLLAGSDTVADSVELMLLLLSNYPEYQEKAYDEIVSVIGKDQPIQLSHRTSTPIVNAVIKEIMRYKPVGAFGLPRQCTKDTMINGYFIPKGSQILPNFTAIYQNPKYWQNPKQFDPSRFINNTNSSQFIPYGVGNRNCIGQNLANDELYLGISNIISKFKFSSVNGKKIDETENFGLTLHPNLFKVKLEKRN